MKRKEEQCTVLPANNFYMTSTGFQDFSCDFCVWSHDQTIVVLFFIDIKFIVNMKNIQKKNTKKQNDRLSIEWKVLSKVNKKNMLITERDRWEKIIM